MDTQSSSGTGGATYYAQARSLRESGVPVDQAIEQLITAGMDATRARDLARSVYGSPTQAATVGAVRAVGRGSRSLARSVSAGIAAAVVCGLGWGIQSGITGLNFGIIAWGVGAGIGYAVYIATPEEHRDHIHLPFIASMCAILGIIIGRYFGTMFLLARLRPEQFSIGMAFSPMAMMVYVNHMGMFMGAFDFLWWALAVISAYKIAAQDQ